MKSICSAEKLPKYATPEYVLVEEGIFKYNDEYLTCLSFEQEPEFDEGENAADISEYPLEDILDRFNVYVSDSFDELNTEDSTVCYQEFSASKLEYVRNLRTIIGKHVYNRECEVDGRCQVDLVIE